MPYSFSVKAANKEAAKIAVAAKFDEGVLAHQPVHARDRDALLATAGAVIDLLTTTPRTSLYRVTAISAGARSTPTPASR